MTMGKITALVGFSLLQCMLESRQDIFVCGGRWILLLRYSPDINFTLSREFIFKGSNVCFYSKELILIVTIFSHMTDIANPHEQAQHEQPFSSTVSEAESRSEHDREIVDKELAEHLSSIIEDTNERVIPLCKMIRKAPSTIF